MNIILSEVHKMGLFSRKSPEEQRRKLEEEILEFNRKLEAELRSAKSEEDQYNRTVAMDKAEKERYGRFSGSWILEKQREEILADNKKHAKRHERNAEKLALQIANAEAKLSRLN
jgi:wyosine [tRNA(Phe)-imidazoG37] synthetase (radical SAM superfamily)